MSEHSLADNKYFYQEQAHRTFADATMNIFPEQSNFSANQNFPMGVGKGWERFLQEHVSNCDIQLKHVIALRSRDDKILSHTGIATAQNKAKYVTDTDVIEDMDDGPERNRRRFYGIINKAKSDVLRSPLSIVNHTTAPARVGTLVEDMWPESINSNYLDPVSKKIVPPKNSIEAANRADAPMWKRAYEIERDILIKMGCFQYGFTLAERWGIHRSHFNRK
jgi:hypothetical protein